MANEKEAKPTSLNIYGRIQKTRAELVKKNLKKSGVNKYTQNTYYELGDFMPELTELMYQNGIASKFLLEEKQAKLWIINVDKPEKREIFYIPVAASEVKGATAIQNLGAQMTYLRRYLHMNAFEIAEGDTEDAQAQEEIKHLDTIHVDKINGAKNLKELATVSQALQAELGPDFRKALVAEYTRRKKEIEAATSVGEKTV